MTRRIATLAATILALAGLIRAAAYVGNDK